MVPLTSGRVCISQTGHCLNNHLREHQMSMRNKTGSHLLHHCIACESKPCEPFFNKTKVLSKSLEQGAKELIEALYS